MSNNIKSFQITQNNPKPRTWMLQYRTNSRHDQGAEKKNQVLCKAQILVTARPWFERFDLNGWLLIVCNMFSWAKLEPLRKPNYNATLPRILTLIRRLNFADHNAKSLKQTMQGGERATNSMEFQLLVLGRSVQGFLDMPVRDNLNGSNLRGGTRQEAKPLGVKAGCV